MSINTRNTALSSHKTPVTKQAEPQRNVSQDLNVANKDAGVGTTQIGASTTQQPLPAAKQKETMSFLETIKNKFSEAKTEMKSLASSSRQGAIGMAVTTQNKLTDNAAAVGGWGGYGLAVAGQGVSLEKVGVAVDFVVPALKVAANGLMGAVGGVSIALGLREINKAASCFNRADALGSTETKGALEGLKAGASESDQKEISQLMDDLKFCEDSNRTKAKDKAISGVIDTVLGATTLLGACTGGVALPVVVGLYVVGYAAKGALRICRGMQQPKGVEKPIEQRLEKNIASLQNKIKNGEALDVKDKALLVGLKSVKLLDPKMNIHQSLTDDLKSTILSLGHEDVNNKFTGQTISIHLDKNASVWSNVKSFVGGLAA